MRRLEPARPQDVGLSIEGLERVDAAVQACVDQGVLAGAVTLVARGGRLVRQTAMGLKDIESGEPLAPDTIFRVFSMTKPVTASAMMILHDQGLWDLDDPVSRHLPEFADLRVFVERRPDGEIVTTPAERCPTMRELMTHTAGLGYGLQPGAPVDDLYREARVWKSASLAELSARVAGLPLAYAPGEAWAYSIGMDIQGAIIERLSGRSLPDFMREKIFGPLGMVDTDFHTPPEKSRRLATLYFDDGSSGLKPIANPLKRDDSAPPVLASGGGGLVSTAGDYARYAQMLLNEGEWDGRRILSPQAVRLQMTNHLPDWMMQKGFGIGKQQIRPGFGIGLNGVVFTDPAAAGVPVGRGTYHWDGAAGTWFWADPENDLLFVGMIQLMSQNAPPLQARTQTLMAGAIVGPART